MRIKGIPNVSVDRPCDVHLIEAWCRGEGEVLHCEEWGRVPHVVRLGVVVMDCPQPGCAPDEVSIGRKCRLDWRRMGESLWPVP